MNLGCRASQRREHKALFNAGRALLFVSRIKGATVAMRTLGSSEVSQAASRVRAATAFRGGNPYRARAYTRAAENLLTLAEPLENIVAQNRLRERGVWPGKFPTRPKFPPRGRLALGRPKLPCSECASARSPQILASRQHSSPPFAHKRDRQYRGDCRARRVPGPLRRGTLTAISACEHQGPARHCIRDLSADSAILRDKFCVKLESRAFLLRRVGDKTLNILRRRALHLAPWR